MAVLGELESAVMAFLWASTAPLSVRDVHARVGIDRDLAYTTVMTVLDRLAKKGTLTRVLEGRAWLYSPATTRLELVVAEVTELLSDLDPAERVAARASIEAFLDGGAPAGR
jgi:predicted transcriptional regulator